MKILEKLKYCGDSRTPPVTIEQLKVQPYEMKYFNECRELWKTAVPERGKSGELCGEVLRQIEKLRYEAQNNGNANWEEEYESYCRFIGKTLCAQDIFTEEEKRQFRLILNFFSRSGRYSVRIMNGEITEEEFDPDMLTWAEDNLYDILADGAGKMWSLKRQETQERDSSENT